MIFGWLYDLCLFKVCLKALFGLYIFSREPNSIALFKPSLQQASLYGFLTTRPFVVKNKHHPMHTYLACRFSFRGWRAHTEPWLDLCQQASDVMAQLKDFWYGSFSFVSKGSLKGRCSYNISFSRCCWKGKLGNCKSGRWENNKWEGAIICYFLFCSRAKDGN